MKRILAIAAAMTLSTAAMADWAGHFKMLDTDGSGKISRPEWEKNWQKLNIEPVPTFTAMDTDVNNGIDEDEWAAAEKVTMAFPTSCKSTSSSWCEK